MKPSHVELIYYVIFYIVSLHFTITPKPIVENNAYLVQAVAKAEVC